MCEGVNYGRKLILALIGPQLFRVHNISINSNGFNYIPNNSEILSQKCFTIAKIVKSCLIYSSPLWISYSSIHGGPSFERVVWFLLTISMMIIVGYTGRVIGRLNNQEYLSFLEVYDKFTSNPSDSQLVKQIKEFDFEFKFFPTEFSMNNLETCVSRPTCGSLLTNIIANPLYLPLQLLAYLVSQTFGISVAYPGSTSMIKLLLGEALVKGRAEMIEKKSGMRSKLIASDGNIIDTMFIDQRKRSEDIKCSNSNTLVVCCEGNAGFYEVGCMVTPLEAGYSVLGWNHPGFGGSSGKPFPDAEVNAIDVVMQFAIHHLHFLPEQILIFAWSIGGFAATKAAAMYPEVQGLVLDATFHDILPLGLTTMPPILAPFTTFTIRNYLNLHNSANLRHYSGPVRFIRRTQDEVMNVGDVSSNRGNMLVEDFLWMRFPKLFCGCKTSLGQRGVGNDFKALWQWLSASTSSARDLLWTSWSVDIDKCHEHLQSCEGDMSRVGINVDLKDRIRLLLFLTDKVLSHYDATHCVPLPSCLFLRPWKFE